MSGERHISWPHVGTIVALACVWLSMLLFGTGPLDRSVYEALYAGRHLALIETADFFTALGEPTVLIGAGVACWLWLWYAGKGRLGLVLLAIALLGRGLSEVQKYLVARARPDLQAHLVIVKTKSFPSGHANSSMIFYFTIALALAGGTRWARSAVAAAIVMSLCVGISRVMLGVHWPSDVIGGWSFGLLWVLLTLRPAERLFAPKR